MNNMPWNLIRSFLAVTEHGSLSAAARALGVSQPTLSRDIQALESRTHLNLFQRSPQGLKLTEAGQALVESARNMKEHADTFARQTQGLSTELEGDICISASEIVGVYMLPAAIAAFRQLHPAVNIEVVISNRVSNLNKRESDIALRMFRPTQPGLVARRLPDMPLGFYAHRDYLEQRGAPRTPEALKQHHMIGFDQDTNFIDGAQAMGYTLTRADFHLRSDNIMMQIQLARQACGIVVTQTGLARHWPELVPILQTIPLPALEFWVVCHADTQHNARIRAFKAHLITWFKDDPYHGCDPVNSLLP
jgi:DNA-binding transcriptional LysR family regulator